MIFICTYSFNKNSLFSQSDQIIQVDMFVISNCLYFLNNELFFISGIMPYATHK